MSVDVPLRLWVWAATDPGYRRDRNEDGHVADAELGLVGVCDGMGGHAGGGTASQLGIEALVRAVRAARSDLRAAMQAFGATVSAAPRTTQPMIALDGLPARRRTGATIDPAPRGALLRAAASRAAQEIYDAAAKDPALHGMGTTMTALWIADDHAHGVHCGDSRAYHWRDGRLVRLTEDHTWVAEQLRVGAMRPEDIAASPYRHVITRSVGFEPEVDADGFSLALEAGDGLLLCSDGLTNYVPDDELGRLTAGHGWAALPGLLIDLANRRGGDDNITVVCARVGNDAGA